MADWVVIYKCTTLNNANIVKDVLTEHQIDAVIINKTDSMHIHLTNGDIEVHVNSSNVINAKHLITKHQL